MCEFEKKVCQSLNECGFEGTDIRLGVAVSGGADSLSLLLSLSEIFPQLYVITINHNIRPASESQGDVDFVREICEELNKNGHDIVFESVELESGLVNKEAAVRGGGIEEAARFLRYEAFNNFIKKYQLQALCLAHNKNDQLETLLMRFLQGSPLEALGGIRKRRDYFVRPLLEISRNEIETYLDSRGYKWRTDKSNYETEYFRNRIRHKLVPLLDCEFPGWQKALLSGAEKACEDWEIIKALTSDIKLSLSDKGCVELPLKAFMKLPDSIKYRKLLEACNLLGEASRIPRGFLKDVINSIVSDSFTKRFGSIIIIRKKEALFVKKYNIDNTDYVFFDIINKSGDYEFPFGILSVYNIEENLNKTTASVRVTGFSDCELVSTADKISLPFCIRSVQMDDSSVCADGSEKKVTDILSDWHIPPETRSSVPVIQNLNDKSQQIVCIFAGFLGYKDWIVKL